jgi:hypothetical protein
MIEFGPKPPSRREEDFPKTTTIPEGWIAEALPSTTGASNSTGAPEGEENTRPAPVVEDESLFTRRENPVVEDESLFTRRLDPFPKPNTIPDGWDLSTM